jgi:hypothetical protein
VGISRNLRMNKMFYTAGPMPDEVMMPKLAPMGRQVVGGRAAELQCHQASEWPVTAAVSAPQCSRNGRAEGGGHAKLCVSAQPRTCIPRDSTAPNISQIKLVVRA